MYRCGRRIGTSPVARKTRFSIAGSTSSLGSTSEGTRLNAKRAGGVTPLHQAALRGNKEVAELLIANGADVNEMSKFGDTLLHFAAFGGHKEIVELLIAEGADVNAMNNDGETPLDEATDSDHLNDTAETADVLRKHGGKTWKELEAEGK